MKRYLVPFNTYLWILLLALLTAGGCKTAEKREEGKEGTFFRIHIESGPGAAERSDKVSVYRESPLQLTIDRSPILDEASIVSASVVDTVGGYSIQVIYDAHGKIVLENITGSRRGRRLVILAQWTETRWLAAPMIARPILDGVVTFTPDASRGESERIVRGINNIAKKLHK